MRATPALILLAAILAPGVAAGDIRAAMDRARAKSFDASETVACAQEAGQALGPCRAQVARAGGSAVVVVTFANGFARRLSFADGAFLRGDATMSGVGTDTDWDLSGGLYRVRVDDQRYEIPASLVFGD